MRIPRLETFTLPVDFSMACMFPVSSKTSHFARDATSQSCYHCQSRSAPAFDWVFTSIAFSHRAPAKNGLVGGEHEGQPDAMYQKETPIAENTHSKHETEQRRKVGCSNFCSAVTCPSARVGGQGGLHKGGNETPHTTWRPRVPLVLVGRGKQGMSAAAAQTKCCSPLF